MGGMVDTKEGGEHREVCPHQAVCDGAVTP